MKKGDLVKIKLTGEIGMIIEEYVKEDNDNNGYENGFMVRLPNYTTVKFFDFELKTRNEKN